MAQPWLHCGCSEALHQKLRAEPSSPRWRIDPAETLKLCAVVIALHPLERMHKSIQIRPRQLTVLLPLHGAGVGSQRWRSQSDQAKLGLIAGEKYSENL